MTRGVPPSKPAVNTTFATPSLSVAIAPRRIELPGAAAPGTCSVTAGSSLSGCAEIVNAICDEAALPAASRATALTGIVAPGWPTAGTSTSIANGGAVNVPAGIPDTVNATDATPMLSDACACTCAVVPGRTECGPLSPIAGGVRSTCGAMC